MKLIKTGILIVSTILIAACSSTKISQEKWQPAYRIQGGINKGGIAENTHFDEMEETPVDAYSGATNLGANAGARVLLPLGKNAIETGADIMYNRQKFTYQDGLNQFNGEKTLNVYQIMVPLVYSFGIYRKFHQEGLIQLKLGYTGQLSFIQEAKNTGTSPEFSYNKYSGGFTIGLSSTPVTLKNGNKIGFYFDVYRGGQIYKDFYNKAEMEEPGSSFFKTGLIFHFGQ